MISSTTARRIPYLIYGTAGKQAQTDGLVRQAITAGFRAFDSAAQPKSYDEGLLGSGLRQALANTNITRNDLWIQSKFTPLHNQDEKRLPYTLDADLAIQIKTSIERSLKDLALDGQSHLDALLLHSLFEDQSDTQKAWQEFSAYVPHTVGMIGLSNISMEHLDKLYHTVDVKPAVIQNRFCADDGYDQRLRLYCRDKDIAYQCYGVLTGNGHLLESSPVQDLASQAGVTQEASLYSLVALGLNISVLNGTTSFTRMKEDLAALDRVRAWRQNNRNRWMSILSGFKGSLSRGRVL